MQFKATFFTLASVLAVTSALAASAEPKFEKRIADPGNPANLVNCEPGGGADACHLEKPCKRIRINYGQPEGGHYIWFNNDINHIPAGAEIEVEDSCSDY